MQVFFHVLRREIRRFMRHRNDLLQPLIFFLLVVTLISLAIGPDERLFSRVAPAMAWVAVVLAITLRLDALFNEDYADGTLEQFSLGSTPLVVTVAAKLVAHWIGLALPQIISAIIFMLAVGTAPGVTLTLCGSLLLGTPTLIAIGAIANALTLGARAGGTLVALLAVPLYLPILIFGAGAVTNAGKDLPVSAELYFLAGISVLAITLCPLACAASIRTRLAV